MLVRDLEETATLETDPVCVLLYPKVESVPVLATSDVILFNEVGSLATIETSNYIESLVIECDCSMEVSSRVETGHLSPRITSNIVYFTLVHALTWQRTSNGVDLAPAAASENRCERVSPSLEDHVSPLLESFINELVAALRGFAWFSTSCQEDSALFILD